MPRLLSPKAMGRGGDAYCLSANTGFVHSTWGHQISLAQVTDLDGMVAEHPTTPGACSEKQEANYNTGSIWAIVDGRSTTRSDKYVRASGLWHYFAKILQQNSPADTGNHPAWSPALIPRELLNFNLLNLIADRPIFISKAKI